MGAVTAKKGQPARVQRQLSRPASPPPAQPTKRSKKENPQAPARTASSPPKRSKKENPQSPARPTSPPPKRSKKETPKSPARPASPPPKRSKKETLQSPARPASPPPKRSKKDTRHPPVRSPSPSLPGAEAVPQGDEGPTGAHAAIEAPQQQAEGRRQSDQFGDSGIVAGNGPCQGQCLLGAIRHIMHMPAVKNFVQQMIRQEIQNSTDEVLNELLQSIKSIFEVSNN